MNKPSNACPREKARGLSDRLSADFDHDQPSIIPDNATQSLISAAILTSTAFRLRDNDGLIAALRLLVRAVKPFEAEASKTGPSQDG